LEKKTCQELPFKHIFATIAKMGLKRGKLKIKNNIGKNIGNNGQNSNNDLNDLCWTVDENKTYSRGDVIGCNIQNYYSIIDTKPFEKMDSIVLKKFRTANENGNNVELIFHEKKNNKVLKLAELKIGNADIRMIARKRFKRKVNDKNFYLIEFNEIADHAKIVRIREKGNAMQTIDV
jgi:hypothetical protein